VGRFLTLTVMEMSSASTNIIFIAIVAGNCAGQRERAGGPGLFPRDVHPHRAADVDVG